MVKKVDCAGIIPVRKIDDEWHVYMVKHAAGHWAFPKGKTENNETFKEAATREFKEETGMTIRRWLLARPYLEDYTYEEDGETVEKRVMYMLAIPQGKPKLDGVEVVDGKWVPIPEAQNLATHDTTRQSCIELIDTMDVLKIMEIID